jgi:prophage DNA circulation protein
MASIFDIPSIWRNRLRPASYKGARFHCEVNSRESGRRIVEHEFPKKEKPYAEDMGHSAQAFNVRGYCIVFPYDSGIQLYNRDYRIARDRLRRVLDAEGPGALQLPTQKFEWVVCARYRLTEEERFGGFCIFDMTFMEYGLDPQITAATADTEAILSDARDFLRDQLLRVLAPPTPQQEIVRQQRQQQDV